MADATVAALQHSLNRFAGAASGPRSTVPNAAFAAIATDGIWGPQTADALSRALLWIDLHAAVNADYKLAARQYRGQPMTADTRGAMLTQITGGVLKPVADLLGLTEAPAPSSGGGGGGGMIYPVTPGTMPVTPTAPPLDPSGKQSSISVLGLQLPRWALYLGGGALALAVIGLVATRKKPTLTPAP
jgi:hypothetical protein